MANFQRGGDDRGGRRDGARDSRGGDRGGRGGFDNKRSFSGARRGDNNSQMHKATCGDCGKSCEVPFRPTGEKPVFCRDCFGAKKDPSNKYGSRDEGRNETRSYNNDSVERSVSVETKPGLMGSDVRSAIATINARIESLSFSIEKLNKMVETLNTKKEETKVEVKKEAVVEKVTTKKVAAKKTIAKTIVKAPVKKEVAKTVAKKAVNKVAVKKVAKKTPAKK